MPVNSDSPLDQPAAPRKIDGWAKGGWSVAGWAVAGMVAGLLVALVITAATPREYTSQASVRIVPPQIPEQFAPGGTPLEAHELATRMNQDVLSRNTLTSLIQTYDLYPDDRQRTTVEDITERFQKAVRVEVISEALIELAFTYRDPKRAQKVTRDLMSRLINENVNRRAAQQGMAVQFLKEQADSAAQTWESTASIFEKKKDWSAARRELENRLALERFETLRRRAYEAETLLDVELRKQGSTLEVLDQASLPEEPDLLLGMSDGALLSLGALAGLASGLVAALVRRLLAGAPSPAVPEAA